MPTFAVLRTSRRASRPFWKNAPRSGQDADTATIHDGLTGWPANARALCYNFPFMSEHPNEYFETAIRVRYAETDQMGVVYHGNYFTWFEVGRVDFCRQLGLEYKQMESEDDSYIVVADAHCRF